MLGSEKRYTLLFEHEKTHVNTIQKSCRHSGDTDFYDRNEMPPLWRHRPQKVNTNMSFFILDIIFINNL